MLVPHWRLRAAANGTVVVVASLLLSGCAPGMKNVERRQVHPDEFRGWSAKEAQENRDESPFLKAHMRNGDLFVLEDWTVEPDGSGVSGTGRRYNAHRQEVSSGVQHVAVDSVALFETNRLVNSGAATAITVMVAITATIALICAFTPKTCFGSCPTFYLFDPDRPAAEGFSASIAPSLEATDIDAVFPARATGGPLEIVMKNEALETHVVRFVNVLAAPHDPGTRVFATAAGDFWQARTLTPPGGATGPEGDVLALLRDADRRERSSPADSSDLAARETLVLDFADPPRGGRCGLVIGCRQSLLSTYVLYQTLAYMGTRAGHWIAEIERGRLGDAGTAVVDLLGGIAVSVESSPGSWTRVGEIREFGPIATDHHLVGFDAPATWTGRVALEMVKGGWRIDDVALAALDRRVEPIRLTPVDVAHDGVSDASALAVLRDPARALTTLPGDAYTLLFEIPDHGDHELFIESRGYYLEWIREEWIREESPERLAEVFFDPRAALARMAPEYKRHEPGMERAFWGSRYAKP